MTAHQRYNFSPAHGYLVGICRVRSVENTIDSAGYVLKNKIESLSSSEQLAVCFAMNYLLLLSQ